MGSLPEGGVVGLPKQRRRPHILMIPFEEQGHFSPFLQILYHLCTLDVTVTMYTNKRRVVQLRELQLRGDFLDLNLRLVRFSDEVTGTADTPGGLPPIVEARDSMERQFQPHRAALLAEKDPDAKPTCMLAEMFLDWAEELARELQIPRYVVISSSGWSAYITSKHALEGWEYEDDDRVDVPGFPGGCRSGDFPKIIMPLVRVSGDTAGLLTNSSLDIEIELGSACESYLQKLAIRDGSPKVPRYFPIGPLVNLPRFREIYGASKAQNGTSRSHVLQWLDARATSSVLYVAFGTMANVSASLIFELARGLELSGVPFLWALRLPTPTTEVSTILPLGFLANVEGRGLVETTWVPQLQVLSHPSIGGFMSHCGWNSSLEAISAGVPILTWPLHGDQPLNSRLHIEVLKIALPVRELHDGYVMTREAVATSIKALVIGNEGKELRKNAAQLKEVARASMQEGGSSHRKMREFIDEIFNIQ